MAQEVFKAPNTKRVHPKKDHDGWSPTKKRKGRVSLLAFCDIVLEYTQYESSRSQDLRCKNNTSPMDSEGGTADSFSSESNSSSMTDNEDNRLVLERLGNPLTAEKTGNEDEELITCFCMKPYAGRPMIECSVCLTWIHLSCAKIRRTNIPEEFICASCKDSRAKKRKSNRLPNVSSSSVSFRDSAKHHRRSSPL